MILQSDSLRSKRLIRKLPVWELESQSAQAVNPAWTFMSSEPS
jgi:hypothetical protein